LKSLNRETLLSTDLFKCFLFSLFSDFLPILGVADHSMECPTHFVSFIVPTKPFGASDFLTERKMILWHFCPHNQAPTWFWSNEVDELLVN